MDNYNIYLKYISYIYNYSNKKIYIENLKGFFINLSKCNIITMNSLEELECLIRQYKDEGLIEIKKEIFNKRFYINKVNINISLSNYSSDEINILNSFINRIF